MRISRACPLWLMVFFSCMLNSAMVKPGVAVGRKRGS